MKFDRNKTFPYPVLRPFSDDYIDGDFQTSVEFLSNEGEVILAISFKISSNELVEQIKLGKAKFIALVSCRETYFRKVIPTNLNEITERFYAGDLKGEVRVDSYVVAVSEINNYISADINPEFGKDSFFFGSGDVLAQEDTAVFYVDRDLFKPLTSVFDLVKNDSLGIGEWKVGLDDDHVQIEVGLAMKESIDNARNNPAHRVALLNSLYFSAAVHAIQKLKELNNDYEERKWSRVISRQIHNMGLDLVAVDAYVLAQKLMKYPLAMLNAYVLKGTE